MAAGPLVQIQLQGEAFQPFRLTVHKTHELSTELSLSNKQKLRQHSINAMLIIDVIIKGFIIIYLETIIYLSRIKHSGNHGRRSLQWQHNRQSWMRLRPRRSQQME